VVLTALTVLAVAALAAGCGSSAGQLPPTAAGASGASGASAAGVAAPTSGLSGLSAATSLTAPDGNWAVVPMGGTGPNLFWQLFSLPVGGTKWSLQTPPAVATNGALILAPQDGAKPNEETLTAGIRPSLDLSFSPVTATADGGHSWQTIVPASGLANAPDALAAAPGGPLLSLGSGQQVSEIASAAAPGWTTLTSQRTLAATAAGRDCALTGLSAVAYTQTGTALVGGDCGKGGVVGIFARSAAGTWQLAGPALPAALSGGPVRVLRLTRSGDTNIALLETGTGASAALVAAWSADGTGHWTLSPAYRLSGAEPVSVSFGAAGASAGGKSAGSASSGGVSAGASTGVGVVLSGNRGVVLSGPRSSWRSVPALPSGQSVTLALVSPGVTEALAASGSDLTVWRLGSQAGRWTVAQRVKVPIEYGSSS
jgi:hypothetical protein